MKIFGKIAVAIFLVLILCAAGGLAYFKSQFPKVAPPQDITIELTEARLQRGKYLATLASCVDCHSERDWTRFAGPVVEGTEGKGGEKFDEALGDVPGTLYAPNITPANLKTWSDGEILRALTEGVNKHGKALFPLMPYPNFAKLSREDMYAVIAYIRSLQPIENAVAEGSLNFPLNLIVRTIPQPVQLQESAPDEADPVKYGEYLVTAASCVECHTQRVKGELQMHLNFAGGTEFRFPNGGAVRAANITPDNETGIGNWTEDDFVKRFKTVEATPVKDGEFNTVMPWTQFKQIEEKDLRAIYKYLRSLPAIKNQVVRWAPKTT